MANVMVARNADGFLFVLVGDLNDLEIAYRMKHSKQSRWCSTVTCEAWYLELFALSLKSLKRVHYRLPHSQTRYRPP